MSDNERYSEEEVGLILHRAAEIQPGRSMSLAELEAVADEAGIDRALVRQAASEVRLEKHRSAPVVAPSGGAFGPTRIVFERTIQGTVDPMMWDDIVAEIRRHLDLDGAADKVGKELIWATRPTDESPRKIRVIVTPRAGKTLVRVEENTGPLAGGVYGGIMGGGGAGGLGWIIPVSIAVLHMPLLIPVFFAVWLYATYLLSRSIFRSVIANRQPQLEGIADGVADLAGELVAPK